MIVTSKNSDSSRDRYDVLVTAAQRAGDSLGLTRAQLQSVIRTDFAAHRSNEFLPDYSFARALTLIRVYESLQVLVGAECGAIVHWMTTHNRRFGSTPIDLIQERSGLYQICDYVEQLRAKAG